MDLDLLFTNIEYKTTTVTIPCHNASDDSDSSDHVLSIDIASSPSASTDYDLTGQILWPVSNLLGHYLASQVGQEQLQNRRVVELGAGCGLPGLVAAQYAEKVVLTDGNEIVLDLLQQNVELCLANNKSCPISPSLFKWGDRKQCHELLQSMGHVDVVVAADVVQWPAVVEPLLHTIKALLWNSKAKEPSLMLGIVNRASSTYNLFFQLAKQLGFACRQVMPEEYLKDGQVPESGQEHGGRETEIHRIVLTDRSQPPILLETQGEDVIVGQGYENTCFLPC
jgi:hypothetical protein